jgi:hypothetical protein
VIIDSYSGYDYIDFDFDATLLNISDVRSFVNSLKALFTIDQMSYDEEFSITFYAKNASGYRVELQYYEFEGSEHYLGISLYLPEDEGYFG